MRRAIAPLLLSPALALGACGGGSSDRDAIEAVIQDVARDSATICEHATEDLLGRLGGRAGCRAAVRRDPDTSDRTIDTPIDVRVDGHRATADFVDNDGKRRHVTFAQVGDEWLVDGSETR